MYYINESPQRIEVQGFVCVWAHASVCVCVCEGNWITDGRDQTDRNTMSQEAVGG